MMIIEMNAQHVAQVAQLEMLCFADPWSESSITSELNNPLSLWLVAEEDGCVLGYIGSQTVMGEADMMNVAVHPEYRRRGIAQALVNGLIDALRCNDVTSLTLEVRATNEPAKRMYEKLGFQQVGVRKNYYRHPREDALILRQEW